MKFFKIMAFTLCTLYSANASVYLFMKDDLQKGYLSMYKRGEIAWSSCDLPTVNSSINAELENFFLIDEKIKKYFQEKSDIMFCMLDLDPNSEDVDVREICAKIMLDTVDFMKNINTNEFDRSLLVRRANIFGNLYGVMKCANNTTSRCFFMRCKSMY